jgi:acyl carrier protein
VTVTSVRSRDDIVAWLRCSLAPLLHVAPAEIDAGRTFMQYGLDSMTAITLAADLESWLGVRVSPTLAWEHPTLDQLATYIAAIAAKERAPGDAIASAVEVAGLTDAQVDAMLRGILDDNGARS